MNRRCVAEFRNWRSFTSSPGGRIPRSAKNGRQLSGHSIVTHGTTVRRDLENEPESFFLMRHGRIDASGNRVVPINFEAV